MIFKVIKKRENGFFRRWALGIEGMAAVEAALIFPILLMLLLSVFDMGNGILANQKAVRASQVVADLITRARSVSDADISDAINAGELSFVPLDVATYGVDIVSVRFDDDAVPEIIWRETRNMSANANVLADVAPLAEAGEGVVVVAVQYLFEPLFSGFVIGDIPMQEVAFARGRRSATVTKE